MNLLAREDEFTLSHGGHTVRLRASLRAALRLERLHDGFGPLLARLADNDTATIKAVIRTAATDYREAEAMLAAASTKPLRPFLEAATGPLLALCAAFFAPMTHDTPERSSAGAGPLTCAEVFAELYRFGTAWMGWTPAETLSATLPELEEAFAGYLAKLDATHGTLSKSKPKDYPFDDRRMKEIEALGYDPAFDRDALMALKSKLTP